jgi:flagellar protein FliO/FliZ
VKSTHHTPYWGRSRLLLFLLVLLLAPILGSQAQESAENTTSKATVGRPLEESLLILDPGEPTEAVDTEEVQGGPLVSSWDFLRMVLILAAVVGVIYLIFWLLKRGMRRQLPQNDLIHLLGTRNLTGNRALHLVELGKQVFLVGAAEGNISLISEIKNQETLDTIALEQSQMQARATQGFSHFFQSFLKSGKQQGSSVGDTIDFMKQQRQRLEKL